MVNKLATLTTMATWKLVFIVLQSLVRLQAAPKPWPSPLTLTGTRQSLAKCQPELWLERVSSCAQLRRASVLAVSVSLFYAHKS